jgi:hypothetical protein
MYGIFTYIWVIFGANVGKKSSTMEHMGEPHKENQFLTVCYGLIKERRVDSGLKKVGWK